MDGNDDGFWDLCLMNESGSTQMFFHNGNLANNVVLSFGFEYCSFKFSRYG